MLAALWLVALAAAPAASPPATAAPPPTAEPAPGPEAAGTPPADAGGGVAGDDDASEARPRPRPPRRSRRTEDELFDCAGEGDPRCGGRDRGDDREGEPAPGRRGPARQVFAPSALRPDVLAPRLTVGASLLGFVVGFGTGFWYGGDNFQGLLFTAGDAGLWLALTGTVIAFNQLVLQNDVRIGRSLGRGERRFGQREENLYIASWGITVLLAASHAYQGVAGIFTARATNAALEGFAIVPLDGGAASSLSLRF